MELFVIGLFAAVLVGCIAAGIPMLCALMAGYVIFFVYSLRRGYRAARIFEMSKTGVVKVKNILITMCLVGILTALWRAAGTIPAIICYTVGFIRPSVFLLMTFLLNSLISFLTGTSFGTAATMGVICMAMARTMNINLMFTGGAALSGAFFGDRCSPVSTSALLVAELTHTNLFQNIGKMMRSAFVPFLASCGLYLILGRSAGSVPSGEMDVVSLFASSFRLGWLPVLPAAIILILSVFRIPVKKAMTASIACAVLLCLLYQKMEPAVIVKTMLLGFQCENQEVSAMMSGGGIRSMINVVLVVCLSSSYEGIFDETGLLLPLKEILAAIGKKASRFAAACTASLVTSMISCNQTLATLLTHQLCKEVEPDEEKFAIDLEDSVIILAPLVPWSIAGAVPLASMSAPTLSLLAAFYLYLVPLWRLVVQRER